MIFRKLERSDPANLLWHFHQKKSQDKQLIESHLSLMSIPETSCRDRKRIHLDKCLPSFCFIRMARKRQLVIRSPPRHSSMAATALGSATESVLRLHGGAGPQQQRHHLVAALLCCQAQRRLASGRRPRGSPDRSRRERTRLGKLTSCASCASLKSHSPTQTLHAI